MTDEEVIARQARQIMELSEETAMLKESIRNAILHIVCIGGPLNDNKLLFTNEQKNVFAAILRELE